MRHKHGFNKLGRKTAHREAMLTNMACSLILHKRITTTVQKAKALRSFVEPVITLSKDDSMHHRRMAFKYLQDKEAVKELFHDVANKVADRPGGYTRILKTDMRAGDNAEMCMMELVDYNEAMLGTKEAKKTTTGRTRRSKVKKTDEAPVVEAKQPKAEEVKAEEVAEEKPAEEQAPESDSAEK
ncbi:MAG: 50S ribosomal protein L17 [Bacteroidetes bacterium GWF2_43_63]|nr:MAG: 50S ribosomal protein L17 [Bacteroidetes bacterium GWE2_42_42]OFY55807.1 MAG: 50S ribosomal protein L17 [Bacteroidetes bacterium GWF2_43_63]HBG71273.1 50S ribosomal protein L17 [Bacteroidales bacterium]HCB60506.1 50S ribosomal protein L17 [Bacteroidales bacterium]HCY22537.1 50S ribosomal protein L17 [Bacteroidales bacterium]